MSAALSDIGYVVLEIGAAGCLTERDARLAATNFRRVVERVPDARIMLAVGDYDDDPRELWNVEEVSRYVRVWARRAGVSDWRAPAVRRLDEQSLALLVLCGAFAPGHPFQVKMREGAVH